MLESKTIYGPSNKPAGVFLQLSSGRDYKAPERRDAKLLEPGNCFFEVIDFLQESAMLPKQAIDYQHALRAGYTEYAKCEAVFRFAAENTSLTKDLWKKDAALKKKLMEVFLTVLARSKSQENAFLLTLTPKVGEKYIEDFLQYQNLQEAPLKKWLQLASDFFPAVGNLYFIGGFAQDALKDLDISDEDIRPVVDEILPRLDPLVPNKKGAILFSILQQTIVQEGGFVRETSWRPGEQPCEALIDLLQKTGYLMVGGEIGAAFYAVPPKQQQVNGMTVSYWTKDAAKRPISRYINHIVVVVGAFVENAQGRVLYIDPTHDWDKRPYPIYMTSYTNFCKRVGALEAPLNYEISFYSHPKLAPVPKPSPLPVIPEEPKPSSSLPSASEPKPSSPLPSAPEPEPSAPLPITPPLNPPDTKKPLVTTERVLSGIGAGIGFWAAGDASIGFKALATLGGGVVGAGTKPVVEKIISFCCPEREHGL